MHPDSSRLPSPHDRVSEARRLLGRDISFLTKHGLDLRDVDLKNLSDKVFTERIEKLPEENQIILRRIWERQRECREGWIKTIQSIA